MLQTRKVDGKGKRWYSPLPAAKNEVKKKRYRQKTKPLTHLSCHFRGNERPERQKKNLFSFSFLITLKRN